MNIIINADDFGISESANKAIVELYKKGVITSTTLLVDMPDSKSAADLAKRDKIPTGLHFNLTLNNSLYKNRRDFERQLLQGKVRKKYVKAELERQYQKMLDLGLTPTHLDTHQHIHNWPQLFPICARFARAKKIPIRLVWEKIIFNPYDPPQWTDIKRLLRKSIGFCFACWNWLVARILRVKTNNALVSVFGICPFPPQIKPKHLRLVFNHIRNKTEYMCHPITAPENTRTSITKTSVQEYNLMTNPEFFAMICNKFNLINFGGL